MLKPMPAATVATTPPGRNDQMKDCDMHDDTHPSGEARFELKRYDAQDAKMELYADVARRATAAMPPALATLVGPLTIAPRLHDDNEVTSPQFRSGPVGELAGGELRIQHLYDGGSETYADDLRDWLLEQVKGFLESPGRSGDYVARARTVVSEAIERDATVHHPARLSSIGFLVGRIPERSPTDVVVELEMLGDGLTPIVERIHATSFGDFEVKLARELATHRRRVDQLAQLRANRQRGLIDETTLRIMEAVGMELGFALDHLALRSELVFDFDDGVHRATIAWNEGVLVTDFWTNDPGFRLRGGEFHLGRRVPETLLTGSIGRRLGPLVDQRYISGDAVITDAYADHGGNAVVSLAVPRQPIPWPLIQ